MTQLQMERAARAAGAEVRAITLYQTDMQYAHALPQLILAAAFSGLLGALFVTGAISLFA